MDTSKKKKIDAKNVVTRELPDVEDNETLPSNHTKADEGEERKSSTCRIC